MSDHHQIEPSPAFDKDAGHIGPNPHTPQRWRAHLTVLGAILVLAFCAFSSWLNLLHEQKDMSPESGHASPRPSMIPVDISSRAVDPQPLTIAEVFPNDTIVIDPSTPDQAYHVIATQEQADCRTSTTGEISTLIHELGCTQVVRATMRSPNGYLVTGGIFNLDTVASVEHAWVSIRAIVDSKAGDLAAYDPTTDKTAHQEAPAATVAGWNVKGHYLAFCVIARTDGAPIPDRDPFASQIMYDIVEMYLKGFILEARATNPAPVTSAPVVR